MTLFANDKVRFIYKLPFYKKKLLSYFVNDNPTDAKKGGGVLSMTEKEREKINFRRSLTFIQNI